MPQDLYLVRLQLMLQEYSRQLRWEAEESARAGDVVQSTTLVNKFVDVELRLLSLREQYRPQGIGSPLANFLAIHGESWTLKRIGELSAADLERRPEPSASHINHHEGVLRYQHDVQTYVEIRQTLAASPGMTRASLAQRIGEVDQTHLHELVHNLCCVGELASAKVGARICLWPAAHPQAPPDAECRVAGSLWDYSGVGESAPLLAEQMERLCTEYELMCRDGRKTAKADPEALTFLDVAGEPGSVDYLASGGTPILFTYSREAIGWGHIDVARFKKVARETYRAAMNEAVPRWGRDPARQTWVVVASRNQFGTAFLREVPEGHPRAFPITLLTTADRNTNPEAPFIGRHAWMDDEERGLDLAVWRAREELDFENGQNAVAHLLALSPKIDFEVPVSLQRNQVLELQSSTNSAGWVAREPATYTSSDDTYGVWIIGPDRAENLQSKAQAEITNEAWYPHGRVCLISETGKRLLLRTEQLTPLAGVEGSYVDRHTWVEHRPRATILTWSPEFPYESLELAPLIEDFIDNYGR